ncbi:site-2 protease family protein [Altericroceibacterium endophyticum]|uniref:Site-2 protease family protein n=1 Tax=Altericroceibacterium endophyticum TaxID=1808508 RepID=A0A6I4T8F1_9SPHN|nr:site-2 protease family protein [Altericroceibacterium endophyticum]MXO66293.1 site-2 protease family protein [Altericroceibacterium endophyticum]
MNETLLTALALIPCLVIAIVFHEVAHGWTALALGDPTAKERRRLTLNPIRHVDPVGTLVVPGMLAVAGMPVFGWAKPVPVMQGRLNNPRYGMMAVAAAGPLSNLVMAAIGAVALGVYASTLTAPPEAFGQYIGLTLNYFIMINVFLAFFNLLPIPPFDGSHIVEGLLPPSAAQTYRKLRPLGFGIVFLILLVIPYFFPGSGIIENVVLPPVAWVIDQFLGLARMVAGG